MIRCCQNVSRFLRSPSLQTPLWVSGSWTLEELSGKLGAPKELVHRKLALWQQQGVLREEAGGRYYVVEMGSSMEKLERGGMLIDSDEERDSNTTTQSEQREEKLQVSVRLFRVF